MPIVDLSALATDRVNVKTFALVRLRVEVIMGTAYRSIAGETAFISKRISTDADVPIIEPLDQK